MLDPVGKRRAASAPAAAMLPPVIAAWTARNRSRSASLRSRVGDSGAIIGSPARVVI